MPVNIIKNGSHINSLVRSFCPIEYLTERFNNIFWIEPLDPLGDAFALNDTSPERRISVLVVSFVVETGEDACLCRVRCKGLRETSGCCTEHLEDVVDQRGERVVECATLRYGGRCGSHEADVDVVEERDVKVEPPFSTSTMGTKPFWASTASVLFRTAVWAYLRVVPFHKALGPIIVVTLVLYYLALFFQDASHAATAKKARVTKEEILDVKITEDSNGIPGKRRTISAELVVAASVDSQPSVRIIVTSSYIPANLRLALRPTCHLGTLSPHTLQDALTCVTRYQHPPHRALHRLYIYTLSQSL